MHFIYKLIALSVVFGLVLTSPAAKVTDESFDDLAYEATFDTSGKHEATLKEDEGGRTVDVILAQPDIISLALGTITNLSGFKTKALAIAAKAIKWVVSKSLFLAIGAVVIFAFCKLTDKCSLALAPAVYHQYIPAQVKDFVTPERLEDAQQFFISAMKKYAEENARSQSWL